MTNHTKHADSIVYDLYGNHPDIVLYTVMALLFVVIMLITIAAVLDYIKTNYWKIQMSPKSLLCKISRLIVKDSKFTYPKSDIEQ